LVVLNFSIRSLKVSTVVEPDAVDTDCQGNGSSGSHPPFAGPPERDYRRLYFSYLFQQAFFRPGDLAGMERCLLQVQRFEKDYGLLDTWPAARVAGDPLLPLPYGADIGLKIPGKKGLIT